MINKFNFPVIISIISMGLYRFGFVSVETCAEIILLMIIIFFIVCLAEFE